MFIMNGAQQSVFQMVFVTGPSEKSTRCDAFSRTGANPMMRYLQIYPTHARMASGSIKGTGMGTGSISGASERIFPDDFFPGHVIKRLNQPSDHCR